MPTKFCVKCGRGVNQNYCPQCGGREFSSSQPSIRASCQRCNLATDKAWHCAGCGRKVCQECIRSYKYLTTLCIDCYKIQDATSDVPIHSQETEPEQKPEPEPGPQIEIIEGEEEPTFFQRIRATIGGVFK